MRAWPRVRAEGKETLGKKNVMEENKVMKLTELEGRYNRVTGEL